MARYNQNKVDFCETASVLSVEFCSLNSKNINKTISSIFEYKWRFVHGGCGSV